MTESPEYLAHPPAKAKIAAALSEITEKLASEFSVPSDEPPPWDDFEWRIARAVAAMQGIATLLFVSLRWKGPAEWRRFLDEQRDHIVHRHEKVAQLLDRIDSEARRHGIQLIGLKGIALHRLGLYRVGERPMADIDLLVRDSDVVAVTRLLRECEYDETFSTWRHRLFESRFSKQSSSICLGEPDDNPIKIEVHTRIQERLPVCEIDITTFVFSGAPSAGINPYPSIVSLMTHLLLHAAGNMRAHALRFIQLCDVARLADEFDFEDWEELLRSRVKGQALWWAAPPLILAARYFPGVIPQRVIDQLSAEGPMLLRGRSLRYSLSDVSWSNMKIYAFPGIEWARTPQEALTFMYRRVWPSREIRAELDHFNLHYPGAATVPWYGISQTARALRWILSRPPRVQTMLPVMAALTQRPRD